MSQPHKNFFFTWALKLRSTYKSRRGQICQGGQLGLAPPRPIKYNPWNYYYNTITFIKALYYFSILKLIRGPWIPLYFNPLFVDATNSLHAEAKNCPGPLKFVVCPGHPFAWPRASKITCPASSWRGGGQAPKLKDVFNYPPPPFFFSFLPAKLKILNLPISSLKNNFIPRLLGKSPGRLRH